MPLDIQPTFAGGEITPSMHSRVDLERYANSLALMRNFFVRKHGGASNRAGFEFIYKMFDPTKAVRLIDFSFNVEQTYILAFSDQEMRVIKEDGVILDGTATITGITQAANGVVTTSAAHGWSNGDQVFLSGVDGMVEVNNRFFTISGVTATTFEINVDTTGYSAYTSGGTAGRVFVLSTPYLEADLFRIKYTQSADVMTLTHPSYNPQDLSRTGHASWTLTAISFGTELATPNITRAANVGVNSGSDNKTYRYKVTAKTFAGDESGPSDFIQSPDTSSMSTTWGMAVCWNEVADADRYCLYKEAATNSNIYGLVSEVDAKEQTSHTVISATAGSTTTIQFSAAHGMSLYEYVNLSGLSAPYDVMNGTNQVIIDVPADDTIVVNRTTTGPDQPTGGTAERRQSAVDWNFAPDLSSTTPIGNDPFPGANDYPSCVTFHQQRKSFGSTLNFLQRIWLTKTGNYQNMDYSSPVKADDSIEFDIAASQVNEVRHLLSLDELLAFTSGAEWVIKGDQDGVLTPDFQLPKKQGSRGSSHVKPLIVGESAVFVQEKGSRIRDLNYRFEADRYISDDLSLLAEHLFEGRTVVDWCFAQEPHSLIWAVMDDGALLSLCYIKEQRIWGWSRHDTDGFFESVASISEGKENVLYAAVRRTVNGTDERFIERLHTRLFPSVEDSFFVDSGLKYVGDSFTPDGISTSATATVTKTAHGLNEGQVIWIRSSESMPDLNDRQYKATNVTANTFQLYDLDFSPIDTQSMPTFYSDTTVVQACTNRLTNLDHLEGKSLAALLDGNVEKSLLVTNGAVDLPVHAWKVNIGLPFISDIETLNVDFNSREVVQSRKKAISRVALEVEETRGLQVGKDFNNLEEGKEREPEDGYGNIPATTGTQFIDVGTEWSTGGRLVVRQDNPLPATILALIPEVVTLERG